LLYYISIHKMEYKISYLYKQLIIYDVQMVAIIMAGITNYENNIYIYIYS